MQVFSLWSQFLKASYWDESWDFLLKQKYILVLEPYIYQNYLSNNIFFMFS